MRKGIFAAVVAVLIVGVLSAPLLVSAIGEPNPPPSGVSLLNPLCPGGGDCANGTVAGLIQSIVNWLFVIATPIAVGMIIFGAIQMLTAAGSEDRFSAGKRTVLYAVIGYAIILIGWGITSIIQSLLSS